MTSLKKPAPFDFKTQYTLGFNAQDDEVIIDLFAGGGGASTGLEMGLGRTVAVAINHNPSAISMHEANHPHARHYQSDVWTVDPVEAMAGRRVGWLHASPDCTHHSQAAGGQPRKKEIRDLSWVTIKWAGKVRPRVISLENVKQIRQWGPLIAKRCKVTGRVMKLDGTVALPGERVPRGEQFLVPDPKRKGTTWRRFLRQLESLGYQVDHWVLKNCDYGDPTIRERLYLVARRDGVKPQKPVQTHAAKPAKGQKKWRTAAECIDWNDLGRSIFTRKKPLAEATLRRVAKGVFREVLERKQPFIVPIANWSREAVNAVDAPLNTVTAWPRGGSFAVASPVLCGVGGRAGQSEPRPGDKPMHTVTAKGDTAIAVPTLIQMGYGEREGQAPRVPGIDKPLGTVVAGGIKHAVVSAFLAQANGGYNTTHSRPAESPMSTVTNKGSQQQLVTAQMITLRNNCVGSPADEPLRTITAGAEHHALVSCTLSPEHEEGALRVAAFLVNYYGAGKSRDVSKPLDTVTTKDRLALVTVWIGGDPYVIVDICLRMLKPRELYRAQGFPDSYEIERGHDGREFNKSEQVHMCGNSVSPGTMAAIAVANNPWAISASEAAA